MNIFKFLRLFIGKERDKKKRKKNKQTIKQIFIIKKIKNKLICTYTYIHIYFFNNKLHSKQILLYIAFAILVLENGLESVLRLQI